MRSLSPQARAVLSLLLEAGGEWRHGYDFVRSTAVKSGTLYPLLIRLEGQGYLEAQWQAPATPGRPPRHAYRLTAAGTRFAREILAAGGDRALAARPGREART
jgi:DNA-binding PadR family transcriptional regulator